MRFELTTYSLATNRSTPELRPLIFCTNLLKFILVHTLNKPKIILSRLEDYNEFFLSVNYNLISN